MSTPVALATKEDITGWLTLAGTVEELFGSPMSSDPHFREALVKNIARGTAFCVRENGGPPGSPLMGGLLFSPTRQPVYELGWLAVAPQWRRQRVGRALVAYAIAQISPPAELKVVTFAEGAEGGQPARCFYLALGFTPAEILSGYGPNGSDRQVFRMRIPADTGQPPHRHT